MVSKRTLSQAILVTVCGGVTTAALGSGFALREQSLRSSGMAMAGDGVSTGEVGSMFSNPATITEFTSATFSLGARSVNASFEWEDKGTDRVPGVDDDVKSKVDSGSTGVAPSIFAAIPLNNKMSLGFGFSTPFAIKSSYDERGFTRYYGVDTEILTQSVDFVGAYKVNNWLSLAAGVQYQQASALLSSAVDLAGIALAANPNSPLPPHSADTIAEFEGKSSGAYGYLLGAQMKIQDNFTVGIGFRSAVSHTIEGDSQYSDANDNALGLRQRVNLTPQDGEIALNAPQSTVVGMRYGITPKLDVFSSLNHTKWSSIGSLDIENDDGSVSSTRTGYDDVISVSVGSQYALSADWLVRGGIGHDPATNDANFKGIRTLNSDRTIYSLGGGYVAEKFSIDAGLSYYQFQSTTATQSSTLYPSNRARGNISAKGSGQAVLFTVGGSYSI